MTLQRRCGIPRRRCGLLGGDGFVAATGSILAATVQLLASGCDLSTSPQTRADTVYIAAGRSANGPSITVYSGNPPTRGRTIRGTAHHRHMGLVGDPVSGDLLWFHGGLRLDTNKIEWTVERLSPTLDMQLTRTDEQVFDASPQTAFANPLDSWPGAFTRDARFVAINAYRPVPQDPQQGAGGILVLSAADLRYHGFVEGRFDGSRIISSPDSCCVLALGARSTDAALKLYQVDVVRLEMADSFDVAAAPIITQGPNEQQVFVGGGGAVLLYDLERREQLAATTLPFVGQLFFDPTRNWLLTGDFGGGEGAGTGSVVALDATSLRRVWEMQVVPSSMYQRVRDLAISRSGRSLYVTSVPPIVHGGDDGSLYVVDMAGPDLLFSSPLEGHGKLVAR